MLEQSAQTAKCNHFEVLFSLKVCFIIFNYCRLFDRMTFVILTAKCQDTHKLSYVCCEKNILFNVFCDHQMTTDDKIQDNFDLFNIFLVTALFPHIYTVFS